MQIEFALPSFSLDAHSREGYQVRQILARCGKEVGSVKVRSSAAVFEFDRAFRRSSSAVVNAVALDSLMRCLVNLNLVYRSHRPQTPALYESGVYYRLMRGVDPWDTIPSLYTRGFGDCKSLAAVRVAELREAGVWCRPVHRHAVNAGEHKKSTMYHILVMFRDGTWEDPSKILGMRAHQEAPL